jgi:hypothetical protein
MAKLGRPDDIRPHARGLLALASGPWTPAEIRSACEANGWPLEKYYPQANRAFFLLDHRLRLGAVFAPVRFAPVPHCSVFLYSHHPGRYPRVREFEELGRDAFDRAFDSSLRSLVGELGRPEVEGVHAIGWVRPPAEVKANYDLGWLAIPLYRYAMWRRGSGLVALQQMEADLYCGEFAVCVFLHPWEEGRPCPRLPLAVWGRSEQGDVVDRLAAPLSPEQVAQLEQAWGQRASRNIAADSPAADR